MNWIDIRKTSDGTYSEWCCVVTLAVPRYSTQRHTRTLSTAFLLGFKTDGVDENRLAKMQLQPQWVNNACSVKRLCKLAITLGGVGNYALATFSRMQAANIRKCFTAAYTANKHVQQPQLCNIYYYALQKELWSQMPMPEDLCCTGSTNATPLVCLGGGDGSSSGGGGGEGSMPRRPKEEPLLEDRLTRV